MLIKQIPPLHKPLVCSGRDDCVLVISGCCGRDDCVLVISGCFGRDDIKETKDYDKQG